MHSIELLLDDETERAVHRDWDALTARDLPSLALHPGASNRPHVTLFVADHLDIAVLGPFRDAVAALPLTLSLGGILVFGAGRRGFVLARHVTVTAALADLHRAVARAAAGRADGVVDLVRPDAWTPHVTLARRLNAAQVGEALDTIGAAAAPTGAAVGARIWDSSTKTITPL